MINPFVICSVEEQTALREYDDQERWLTTCQALGVSLAALHVYNAAALRYAATTPYPNHVVVAYLRRIAREALLRGDGMPPDPEQAIAYDNNRSLAELARRLG